MNTQMKSLRELDESVGLQAKRGCTDCIALLLYVLVLGGWAVLATIAIEGGNPWRLVYGTDYLGNICGKTGHKNAPNQPMPDALWVEHDILWYPFEGADDLSHIMDMGLCVTECPAKGDTVLRYPDPRNTTSNLPLQYNVDYISEARLRRCIPDGNNTDLHKVQEFENLIDVSDFVFNTLANLREAKRVLIYAFAVASGVSIVWLLLVYCCAIPLVFVGALGVVAGFGFVGKVLWDHSLDMQDDGDSDYKWVKVVSVVCWVCGGLFLLLIVFMAGRIVRGARIASQASSVLLTSPSILFIPIFFTALLLAWVTVGVIGFLYIETMTSYSTAKFDWAGSKVGGVVHDIPENRGLYLGCHAFFFLWTAIFILDTGYLATAMTASFWYFSAENSNAKSLPLCSSVHAVLSTFRHHLGTTVVGSLIISICKVVRYILLKVEKAAEKSDNGYMKFVARLLCCCMWCLEKILRFLSEKAYVVTAIEGKGFFRSAGRAVALMLANFAQVAELIASFMILIAKLLVVGSTVIFSYMCLLKWNICPDVDNPWIVIIFIAIMAYFLSSVVVSVYGTIIDTLVLCYCVESERRPGSPLTTYGTGEENLQTSPPRVENRV